MAVLMGNQGLQVCVLVNEISVGEGASVSPESVVMFRAPGKGGGCSPGVKQHLHGNLTVRRMLLVP